MVGNVLVATLISGAMTQVYSLLNSMQVSENIKLFNVKTPGNVSMFTDFFDDLTSIRPFDPAEHLESFIYFPEQDPYSINFQNAGYINSAFLYNGRSHCLNFSFFFACGLIFYPLLLFASYKCEKAGKLKHKLSTMIAFSTTTRIFVESYLDLMIQSALNVKELQWPEGLLGIFVSNYIGIIVFCLCWLVPPSLVLYACLTSKRWGDEKYMERHGTILEGSNIEKHDKKFHVMMIAISFFIRRAVLVLTLIYW